MSKIVNVINLLQSVTINFKESDKKHKYYLKNDLDVEFNYSVDLKFGHVANKDFEKEIVKYIEQWRKDKFKQNLNAFSGDIAKTLSKYKFEDKEKILISKSLELLEDYKDLRLLKRNSKR